MKYVKQFSAVILFLFSVQLSNAQISNADTMVHKIFSVLKSKDEKAFVALYPDKDQMVKLMGKLITGLANELKNAKTTGDKGTASENEMNMDSLILSELQKKATHEEMGKMGAKLEKDFFRTIEQGEEKGIDWHSIQLVNYTIDTASVQDESMVKLFGSDQFRAMKGVLHFKSGDNAFQLSFDQVMFMPEEGGWYGVSFKKLAKEGESMDEEEDIKMEEIAVEGEQEQAPKPKAKSKTKTKTKTSSTKTKKKTKG